MWRTHFAPSNRADGCQSGKSQFKLLLAAVLAAALLSGCGDKTPPDAELQWARSALERNPQVKVIAVDAATNSIQVQVKASGETIAVTPGELAAIPIADLVALAQAVRESEATVDASTSPAMESAPTQVPQSEPEPVAATEPPKASYEDYVVQREDGRVRVTGPGVSIESHASPVAEGVTQRYDDPIVCDGKRMMRMDARRLNVSGDAITVRGGCELHISNSRVDATGAAVVVDNGVVHISNSEIAGVESSLTTHAGARVYLRGNTFSGLQLRDPQATILDQGGNTWR